jgi:hypothetical protein
VKPLGHHPGWLQRAAGLAAVRLVDDHVADPVAVQTYPPEDSDPLRFMVSVEQGFSAWPIAYGHQRKHQT